MAAPSLEPVGKPRGSDGGLADAWSQGRLPEEIREHLTSIGIEDLRDFIGYFSSACEETGNFVSGFDGVLGCLCPHALSQC